MQVCTHETRHGACRVRHTTYTCLWSPGSERVRLGGRRGRGALQFGDGRVTPCFAVVGPGGAVCWKNTRRGAPSLTASLCWQRGTARCPGPFLFGLTRRRGRGWPRERPLISKHLIHSKNDARKAFTMKARLSTAHLLTTVSRTRASTLQGCHTPHSVGNNVYRTTLRCAEKGLRWARVTRKHCGLTLPWFTVDVRHCPGTASGL